MYYLFLFGSLVAAVLPRWLCYKLAAFLATLRFYLAGSDRRNLTYNLAAIISDDKERKKQVKNVFINFAYYLTDFFRYPRLNENFVKKYVRVTGLDNLDFSLARHKGVVVLTAHLGNYELAGAVTSLLGYPVSAVALPHRDKRVNNFFDQRRTMLDIQVIPTGAAVRGCFWALRTGRILAFLGDKDFSGKGEEIKLFSRSAKLPRGPAFFSLKTAAPILPAFFVRVDTYYYHLIFEKPIFLDKGADYDEVSLMKEYAVVLERYLKQYPGQWYMFEKYWLP